jgi:chromosomal replication initiator protein
MMHPRSHLGEDIFTSWFRTLEFEHFDGKTATFSAPVKFIASWIKSHYREELLLACRAAFGTAQANDVIVRRPGTRDLHT